MAAAAAVVVAFVIEMGKEGKMLQIIMESVRKKEFKLKWKRLSGALMRFLCLLGDETQLG